MTSTANIERDLDMMQHPHKWPQSVLPLMNGGKEGILLGSFPTVYLCNMYWMPDDLSKCPQEHYTSYEEIIAAGWRVD